MPSGPFFEVEVFGGAVCAGFLGYFFLLACVIGDRQEKRAGEPPIWLILFSLLAVGSIAACIFWDALPRVLRIIGSLLGFTLIGGCFAFGLATRLLHWFGKP